MLNVHSKYVLWNAFRNICKEILKIKHPMLMRPQIKGPEERGHNFLTFDGGRTNHGPQDEDNQKEEEKYVVN